MTAATLSRPVVPVVLASCDVCFGTGRIYAKPGVLVPCPNGCAPGFSMAGGCLSCGCSPSACSAGCGCGCGCCPYPHPLPA